MTEQSTPSTQGTKAATGTGGTAVAGPLTIRDLAVLGSVVLIFIASLIPLLDTRAGSLNLWNTTNLFYMAVGMILPLATAALFVIRRFSPNTKLRLGSLSLDQFASVVAVFAAFFYFASITTNYRAAYLVGIIGGVLFMLSTVCAPWIPVLAADFTGRTDTPAHPVARDAATPAKRKAAPKPVATTDNAGAAGAAAGAPNGSGAQNVSSGAAAAGAAGAAGASGQGVQDAAASLGGNRPNQSHTLAGQIYTPAKDDRPRTGAGSAAGAASGAVAGAAAGATGAAAAKAASGPDSGASGTAANASSKGQETGKDASATSSDAATTGASASSASASSAPATSAAAGQSAAENKAQDAATSGSSSSDLATTLNPQLAKPGQDQGSTGNGKTAAEPAATSGASASGAASGTAAPAASETAAAGAATSETAAPETAASAATKADEAAPAKTNNAPAKESITATVDPKAAKPAVSTEPFWFAVDRPQNVIDEQTRQFIYKLTPGSWILALEDRGNSFLVQDSRGKTGLLLDLVGIERASDSH